MAFVGGPVQEISINGRTFSVAEDADVTLDLGGFSNEVQMNGNGTSRVIKTRKPGMLESVTVAIDKDNEDQEFLQDIADGSDLVDVSITFCDGNIYYGQSIITGDLKSSSKNATAEIQFSGKSFKIQ